MKPWVPNIVPDILYPLSYLKKNIGFTVGKKYDFNFSGEKTEVQRSKVICLE